MFRLTSLNLLKIIKYYLLILCGSVFFNGTECSLLESGQTIDIKAGVELKLPSLIGVRNELVAYLIEKLSKNLSPEDIKKSPSDFEDEGFVNRLLICGPPGNGKSSLAKDIAKASNCELIMLGGPSIVGSFTAEGARNINILFEEIISKIEKSGRPVIVVIDEIDAIAAYTEGQYTKEYKNALQQLWIKLDEYKNDPRIFFICTTNVKDMLNQAFVIRFGDNLLEIKNPDATMRERIFRHYAGKFKVCLNDAVIKQLVANSDNLCIRSLEDFVRSALKSQNTKKQILSDGELLAILKRMKDNIDNNISDKKTDNNSGSYLGIYSQAASALHSTVAVGKMVYDIYNAKPPSTPPPASAN